MRKDSKNFARHGFLQIATWLRRWDYGVGLRVRVTIVTITVLITIMATIGRQEQGESESSSPLDSQLQTTEDSALQEQLHKTLWKSLYRCEWLVHKLLTLVTSFLQKIERNLVQGEWNVSQVSQSAGSKRYSSERCDGLIKKQWLPRSDVVCWPPHSKLNCPFISDGSPNSSAKKDKE